MDNYSSYTASFFNDQLNQSFLFFWKFCLCEARATASDDDMVGIHVVAHRVETYDKCYQILITKASGLCKLSKK